MSVPENSAAAVGNDGIMPLEEEVLRSWIRDSVPGGQRIRELTRKTFKRRADWRGRRLFERVVISDSDLRKTELCLKYFGTPEQDSLRSRAPLREAQVYRFLNGQAEVGAAYCYGDLDMPEAGRTVLMLEFVRGRRLKKCAAADTWMAVARWLGRVHALLARKPGGLEALSRLPRLDAAHFRRWAQLATDEALDRCPELRGRVEQLLGAYDDVAEGLGSAMTTLVHGEFYCTNIMVRRDGGHPPFCPFDWETASVGAGALDIAYLGRQDLGIEREVLLEAYAEGWASVAESPLSIDELRVQSTAARVHERMYMLWFACVHRRVRAEKIRKYVTKLEGLMRELGQQVPGGEWARR